ncbi:MAG: hypothetical protein MUF39_04270 [Cyclobacteriaceae bacterium]|nr:hypothetical protein [Cyclobacteriaceae bacterium]
MYKLSVFLTFCLLTKLASAQSQLSFNSNSTELNQAFDWAKNKALSFAHDSSDPVGPWYEAALPNREAFCMRDVSHQAIGAQLLGLKKHNFNMFQKFAANISAEKDYCSYWEINRYNKPAPVDYENDNDFWYNLPANFDVIYNAWRLYRWTGDKRYIDKEEFKRFYQLSLNEYVDHWQLGADEITSRNRAMHSSEAKRFSSSRGIPTYNEGGRGETILGVDLSASLIAAYTSYSNMLGESGNEVEAKKYLQKAVYEKKFLEEFWWDKQRQQYRSIQYADKTFDYFMIGKDQAFLHYLLYFDVLADQTRIKDLIEAYRDNYDNLIVELKSYLPIIFYENGYTSLANKMIIDLCSPENKRRDYPENSFTIIEHITRGLMGIEADATQNSVSTLPGLAADSDWSELKNVPVLSDEISVRHDGISKTVFTNHSSSSLKWKAALPGKHAYFYLSGKKIKCKEVDDRGRIYSYILTDVKPGETVAISLRKI